MWEGMTLGNQEKMMTRPRHCNYCENYKDESVNWLPYDSNPSHQRLICKGALAALKEYEDRVYRGKRSDRSIEREILEIMDV